MRIFPKDFHLVFFIHPHCRAEQCKSKPLRTPTKVITRASSQQKHRPNPWDISNEQVKVPTSPKVSVWCILGRSVSWELKGNTSTLPLFQSIARAPWVFRKPIHWVEAQQLLSSHQEAAIGVSFCLSWKLLTLFPSFPQNLPDEGKF